MKPGAIPAVHRHLLCRQAATSRTVATASSAESTVGTTSTSFIAGAGLNQCMPTTSAGREVAVAHSMTGRLDVVVASTAPGFMISSSAREQRPLDGELLDHGFDDEVALREIVELGGAA